MSALHELIRVVARLRAPDGCPWDRAQTPGSMRPYLVEETYEVVDAIERGSPDDLREELGDLLFQVVLLAQMAREAGHFDIEGVAAGIAQKMVERHPHVFEPDHVEEDAGTVAAWEARKARARPAGRSMLDGLPPQLPALVTAYRVGEKVARVGFDWPDLGGVVDTSNLGETALFVYDRFSGGLGYSRVGFDEMERLLAACLDILADCSCEHGCPACVGLPSVAPGRHEDPDLSPDFELAALRAASAGEGPFLALPLRGRLGWRRRARLAGYI